MKDRKVNFGFDGHRSTTFLHIGKNVISVMMGDEGQTGFILMVIAPDNKSLQDVIRVHLPQVVHSLSSLCLTVPSGATSDSLTLQV